MQCLEEGTQKLEEGDVEAAKVRASLQCPAWLTYVRPGTLQTQRLDEAQRERPLQPRRDPLPPQCVLLLTERTHLGADCTLRGV